MYAIARYIAATIATENTPEKATAVGMDATKLAQANLARIAGKL